LDPLARRDLLRDVIGLLQARDVTVFFSSHLLYEIEPICDRVAILHGGQIAASEPVDTLREHVRRFEFAPRADADFSDIPGILHAQRDGDRLVLVSKDALGAEPAIQALSQNGVRKIDLNLDEIFEAYVAGRTEALA
jgi:ABC-2 type transport system ATP-binding protein